MISRPTPFVVAAFVCTNRRPDDHPKPCCAGRGGLRLRDELKRMVAERGLAGRVKVFQSGCLSQCEFGPTVVAFPDGTLHTGVTEADLPALLEALAAAAEAAAGPEDLSAPG